MRIAIVTFFYKPAGGGVPRYVESISKKLAEMGHKIDIITASYSGQKIERDGKITVYRLPCMDILGKKDKENKENSHEFLKFLRNYAKRNPDVILAQNTHAAVGAIGHSLALNMASLESNIPLILTVHAFIQDDEHASLKLGLLKNLYWEKIISVGSTLAEDLFNKGLNPENLKIINPPVDTEKFTPGLSKKWLRSRINVGENETLLMHASRLDSQKVAEEKGVFTLLKAFSSIKDKDVKLLLACAPTVPTLQQRKEETIEKIKETAKLLKIDNRVIIETFDPDEMHHVYSGADLFVMASQMESFGLVYAEALACGIPVIGTSVGGVPEVIDDGKTGELVAPDQPVELAKTIKKLLKNKAAMKKMGMHGREHVVENLNLDKICRAILGICESVIKNNKSEGSFFTKLSGE
jgi:glycosyltransferase involved in cell wall biosynthesis